MKLPQDYSDDESTLVQVIARCCQATSHFLSSCWPSFMTSYGITRPQLVKWISQLQWCCTRKYYGLAKEKRLHVLILSSVWLNTHVLSSMGLLPNTSNCGCACARNAGNVFPATAGKQSRHASRHMRDARAVMHAGIANSRFPLNSAAGGNVPGIPGACATRDFTYLVRGPWRWS